MLYTATEFSHEDARYRQVMRLTYFRFPSFDERTITEDIIPGRREINSKEGQDRINPPRRFKSPRRICPTDRGLLVFIPIVVINNKDPGQNLTCASCDHLFPKLQYLTDHWRKTTKGRKCRATLEVKIQIGKVDKRVDRITQRKKKAQWSSLGNCVTTNVMIVPKFGFMASWKKVL